MFANALLCVAVAVLPPQAGQGGQGGQGGQQPRMPRVPSMTELMKDVDLYPAERPVAVQHFFAVEGEAKPEALTKAFQELKSDKALCRITYGPVSTSSRPKLQFLAVEAPATVKKKDVERALERGGFKADEVAATCFQGPQQNFGGQGGAFGLSSRDWLLGTSADLRWCETLLGFSQFFHVPSKLDAEQIADRVKKLGQPFGRGDIGKLVVHSFTWRLEGTLDETIAKRLEKALLKLTCVKRAVVDVGSKTLAMEVALEGVRISGMPAELPIPEEFKGFADAAAQNAGNALDAPRVRFDTTPVWELLDKELLKPLTIEKQTAQPAEPPADGG